MRLKKKKKERKKDGDLSRCLQRVWPNCVGEDTMCSPTPHTAATPILILILILIFNTSRQRYRWTTLFIDLEGGGADGKMDPSRLTEGFARDR